MALAGVRLKGSGRGARRPLVLWCAGAAVPGEAPGVVSGGFPEMVVQQGDYMTRVFRIAAEKAPVIRQHKRPIVRCDKDYPSVGEAVAADQLAKILGLADLRYRTSNLGYSTAHKNFQAVPSKPFLLSAQCRCLPQVQRFGNDMSGSERALFHQLQRSLLLGFVESSSNFPEDMVPPRLGGVHTIQISDC